MKKAIDYMSRISEKSTIQDKIDISTKQLANLVGIMRNSAFKRSATLDEKKMLAATYDEVSKFRSAEITKKYSILNQFSKN